MPPITGMPSASHASLMPSTTSANCHITSGCSGLPKFRQFTSASGRAPADATLRAASSTTRRPPVRGSSWQKRALPSVASASAFVVPFTRSTAASRAGAGDGVQEQLVVVLARHPRLVGDRRRREQREQLAGRDRRRGRTSPRNCGARIVGLQLVLRGGPRRSAGGTSGPSPRLPDGHVGERLTIGR